MFEALILGVRLLAMDLDGAVVLRIAPLMW
jgi:hypothetical protein